MSTMLDLPPGFSNGFVEGMVSRYVPHLTSEFSPVVAWVACPWALVTDRRTQERELKRAYAKALGRFCWEANLPFYLPVLQADALGLDDDDPDVRQRAIEMGHQVMGKMGFCLVGLDGGVTSGMAADIRWAKRYGCIVQWCSVPGWAQQFRGVGCYAEGGL